MKVNQSDGESERGREGGREGKGDGGGRRERGGVEERERMNGCRFAVIAALHCHCDAVCRCDPKRSQV